jgi:hypothetical protein
VTELVFREISKQGSTLIFTGCLPCFRVLCRVVILCENYNIPLNVNLFVVLM